MESTKTSTTAEMLENEIRETLKDISIEQYSGPEKMTPLLNKLKVLHTQQMELQKLELEAAIKQHEIELASLKQEQETALKIRDLELREKEAKENHELEEQKVKEQKKSNVTNAVLGSVTAATGVASILATLHCFKKSMQFEETGSYTNKTGQAVGGLFNLFRRKG